MAGHIDPRDLTEQISPEEPTYRFYFAPQSDTMLISFAVFPAPGGKSAFDFVHATDPIPVKRAFFRDPHMMWYQKGTPGVGNSVPEVAEFVRRIVREQKVRRVVVIGNSGGAYAALLFGVLIGADEVHAFNPSTKLLEPLDTSAPDTLAELERNQGLSSPWLDLRRVLGQFAQPQTKMYIHYSRGDWKDRWHARLLKEFPNVHLKQYPSVTHHAARFFRDRGLLTPLLQAAASGDERALERVIRRMIVSAAPTYLPGRFWSILERVRGRLKRYAGRST